MTYCIRFSQELEAATNNQVRLARKIWNEAKADPSIPVRVATGNYAGYGKYVARCHPSGVIEFPVGNSFSVLQLVGNEVTFRDDKFEYLGTLLHEIGHHIVNTANVEPWDGGLKGGLSTHLRAEWLWICHTGWSYFHDEVPTIANMIAALKCKGTEDRKTMVDALTTFNPYTAPPMFETPVIVCEHCKAPIVGKRRGAKYCGTSCRVMAARQRKSSQVNAVRIES